MTALAGIGHHKELAGDFLVTVNLRGTGKEISLRPVAFLVHGCRRIRRILNSRLVEPACGAQIIGPKPESGECHQADRITQSRAADPRRQPSLSADPRAEKQTDAQKADNDVQIKPGPFRTKSPSLDQNDA